MQHLLQEQQHFDAAEARAHRVNVASCLAPHSLALQATATKERAHFAQDLLVIWPSVVKILTSAQPHPTFVDPMHSAATPQAASAAHATQTTQAHHQQAAAN